MMIKVVGIFVLIIGVTISTQMNDLWTGFVVGTISGLAGTILILRG